MIDRFLPAHAALLFVLGVVATPAFAHDTSCANPYQYAGTVALKPGYGGAVADVPVPRGYRLQIEYASASLRTATVAGHAGFNIGTSASGAFAWYPLPAATGYLAVDRTASQQVKLYADAGSTVKIEIDRDETSSDATGRFSISGCLYWAK